MKNTLILMVLLVLIGCSPKNGKLTETDKNHIHPPIPVSFVEQSATINSLEEVVALFPNKLLYIDIWASWCGPCRMEFAYKNELHDFVADKDIELIYISIDKADKERNWKKMVNRFDLGGYHIIANKQLKDDLVDKFYSDIRGERKMISIPNFVIVNKEGAVKERDAFRPSDEKRLYKQLKRFL